jgi:hypothetical protein
MKNSGAACGGLMGCRPRFDIYDTNGKLNDADSQPHNTLFFASGINCGADGVYGRIDLTTP